MAGGPQLHAKHPMTIGDDAVRVPYAQKDYEANIRGGGKIVHDFFKFNFCPCRSLSPNL